MKKSPWLLVAALVGANSVQASCSHERTPAGAAETATRYDSASRELTLECISASDSTCHFIVAAGGNQRALSIGAGTSSTLRDIDPAAVVCAAASAGASSSCSWVRIHQAA